MYLLDSCTISDFMRGEINTLKKMKLISPSEIYTSTITQMEIEYGLKRKFDDSHRYFKLFEEFLSSISILPFDSNAANTSAQIKKILESQGMLIGPYDILIAGIAKSENLILVTSNEKEFIRVNNLVIENWRQNLSG